MTRPGILLTWTLAALTAAGVTILILTLKRALDRDRSSSYSVHRRQDTFRAPVDQTFRKSLPSESRVFFHYLR